MPKAVLPTTLKGWVTALAASFVGFVAGFVAIKLISQWWR